MKTLYQISKEHGIPKRTLWSRAKRLNDIQRIRGTIFLNIHQEREVLKSERKYHFVEKKPNKLLIFDFKQQNTMLCDEEIAQILGLESIKVDDYIILESKMNKL